MERNNISSLLGKTIAAIKMSRDGRCHDFYDTDGKIFMSVRIEGTFDVDGNYMNDDTPCGKDGLLTWLPAGSDAGVKARRRRGSAVKDDAAHFPKPVHDD